MSAQYQKFLNESMLEFVKKILYKIQSDSSYPNQLLYISYRTDNPLVVLSARIKKRYPKEITIVMQYQFEDLAIKADGFSVTVSFDGIKETIYIPFNSIVSFIDPNNGYSLKFKYNVDVPENQQNELPKITKTENGSSDMTINKENGLNLSPNVIDLDKFRKPTKP